MLTASLNDGVNSSVVTFTFTEAPTNFAADDITAVGGTVTGLAATGDPLVYTATFTATDGLLRHRLGDSGQPSWQDANGNTGAGDDDTVAIDRSNPTVLSVEVSDQLIADDDAGDTFTVTVTFSEAMDTGVNPTPDLCSGGCEHAHRRRGQLDQRHHLHKPPTQWRTANVDHDSVTIDVTGAQNAAGNAQLDYTPETEFSVDTVNPSVIVDIADCLAERRRQQLGRAPSPSLRRRPISRRTTSLRSAAPSAGLAAYGRLRWSTPRPSPRPTPSPAPAR